MPSDVPSSTATRAGYVALVGLPNAGKSTLLNRLVGEHLSIATAKPQTTWQRVTGILTEGSTQLVFLDTPGLLEPRDLLQRSMHAASVQALAEAEVVVLVVDASREPTVAERATLSDTLRDAAAPMYAALNKIDVAAAAAVRVWEDFVAGLRVAGAFRISAELGTGADDLLVALRDSLPASPFFFPDDDVAEAPVRFFVAELVRETIFERYHQEIPHSAFCEVTEFREGQDPVYIRVAILVERQSQKGILIGRGGTAIRDLGSAARSKIEHLLGRAVYLDLWVKPLESWRTSRAQLARLGFRLAGEHEGTS
jgi:GTP-binding protein Era